MLNFTNYGNNPIDSPNIEIEFEDFQNENKKIE